MNILLTILLALSVAINGYLLYVNYRKQTSIDNLIDDFKYYIFKTLMIKKSMEEIDAGGAFESDDVVGRVFQELRKLILNLGIDENQEGKLSNEIDRYIKENKIEDAETEEKKG